MKYFIKNSFLLLFIGFIVSCEEEVSSRNYPRVKTLEVTNITEEGAKFNAEIIFRGGFDITKYGFVWAQNMDPTVEKGNRIVYTDNIQSSSFSSLIETTLKEEGSYYVRAFVETEDFLVYGANVPFISLGSQAPIINSVSPTDISYCDTIFIRGQNFSYVKEQNKLAFGPFQAQVATATDTLLTTLVPAQTTLPSFPVKVSIQGNEVLAQETLTLKKPVIESVSPLQVVVGDTITVRGKFFSPIRQTNRLRTNGEGTQVVSSSCDLIKAIIPVTKGPLTLTVSNLADLSSAPFPLQWLAPEITQLSPNRAFIGNQIEIQGKYFGNLQEGITIKVDTIPADIISYSNENILIEIPKGIYSKRSPNVSICVKDSLIDGEEFTLLDPWIRKTNIPSEQEKFKGRYGGVGFSVGEVGFVGLGDTGTDFWRYDPQTNQWSGIQEFPGSARFFATSFSVGGLGYVVGGRNDKGENVPEVWEYNPNNNNWRRLADFPHPVSLAVGKSSESIGYIVTRRDTNNFWAYDPIQNKWEELPELTTIAAGAKGKADAGFFTGEKLYIYASGNSTGLHQLYEFDFARSSWSQKTDLIGDGFSRIVTGAVGYANNNKGYLAGTYQLFEYDPQNDTWIELSILPESGNIGSSGFTTRKESVGFFINEKLYFGAGRIGGNDEHDFHELDVRFIE